ncbi:hypothetical protein PQX77_020187 [Marasmius sp. AFHP31]|nr:hypothetical protein PQX77_020187 [Marasmius sp. AFHP31]
MATINLYTKFTPQRTIAIREGLRMLRNVFASDASKEGLTTSELYKLALKEKPGKEFLDSMKQEEKGKARVSATGSSTSSGVEGKEVPPTPPNPKHPLKSMTFLKKEVLPILEGNQEIRLAKSTRIPVVPTSEDTQNVAASKGKKGKKKDAEVAAPPPAHPVTVWLWKTFRTTRPDSNAHINGYNGPFVKTRLSELGLNVSPTSLDDVGHLNRRRKFARYEKLFRESAKIQREQRRIENGSEKESFTTAELASMRRNDRDEARKLKLF